MSLGMGKHRAVIRFLKRRFEAAIDDLAVPWIALPADRIGLRSPRGTRWNTSRISNAIVLPVEQWEALVAREAVIDLHEPPPLFVVEVVSDSTQSIDYCTKLSEYAVLDIPEYWIVDPLQDRVTVCELNEGLYDTEVFVGEVEVRSSTFTHLKLTATQVLAAKL